MLRRKKHMFYKSIRYGRWFPQINETLFKKAMQRNFFSCYQLRLGSLFQERYVRNGHTFYKSSNKLQCAFDYHFSVPSRKLRNSRFFLNKAVDKLVYPHLQK